MNHWILKPVLICCTLASVGFRICSRKSLAYHPHKYLLSLRIDKAKELLSYSSMNIAEISVSVGFPDSLYFSRLFRRYTGYSPMNYRNLVSRWTAIAPMGWVTPKECRAFSGVYSVLGAPHFFYVPETCFWEIPVADESSDEHGIDVVRLTLANLNSLAPASAYLRQLNPSFRGLGPFVKPK